MMHCSEKTEIGKKTFFRLGLSIGLSNLEFHDQFGSFEGCLRGAAHSPLDLRYPFRPWPGTRMTEGDRREASNICFWRYTLPSSFFRILKEQNIGHRLKLPSYFAPTTFFSWPPREFDRSTLLLGVVAFRYRISRQVFLFRGRLQHPSPFFIRPLPDRGRVLQG